MIFVCSCHTTWPDERKNKTVTYKLLFVVTVLTHSETILCPTENLDQSCQRSCQLNSWSAYRFFCLLWDEFYCLVDTLIEEKKNVLTHLNNPVIIVFIQLFHERQPSVQPCIDYWFPTQVLWKHVHHTTSANCSRRSHSQIHHLEQHSHSWGQLYSLTIGKTKHHVVIKNSVHVLNPKSINRSIENYPVGCLRILLTNTLSHNWRGKTITPLLSQFIDFTIQLSHRNCFRI